VELGETLSEKIRTFIAIAGANYGVSICNI